MADESTELNMDAKTQEGEQPAADLQENEDPTNPPEKQDPSAQHESEQPITNQDQNDQSPAAGPEENVQPTNITQEDNPPPADHIETPKIEDKPASGIVDSSDVQEGQGTADQTSEGEHDNTKAEKTDEETKEENNNGMADTNMDQKIEDNIDNTDKELQSELPSEKAEAMQMVEQSNEKKETVEMATEVTGETHEVDPKAKSPSPVNTGPPTATVKFVLMPSGHVSTKACILSAPMQQTKQDLANLLRMPTEKLIVLFDSIPVEDNKTLADLGVEVNGAVQLEVVSSDPVNIPIKPPKPQPEYNMPDIITVKIDKDDTGSQDIVVEIERTTRRKPFLGGFRNRMTGVEYLHASAQTRSKVRPDNGITKFCRDTQTVSQRHKAQQVTRNTSTQMTTIGCYVSNMTDKLITPGKYTTAYEYHQRRLNAVIVLQSYFRKWQAKRHVVELKEDMKRRREWERQEEMRKIREKDERIKLEFERRMNPKAKEDFDLLYHALEKWRQEEVATINASLTGAARKAALCHLLDQETQLISAIGRHKLQADTENKQKSIMSFLEKAAAPRKWKSADGKYTEMDTAYTIRARELKDIYNSLNMKYLTQDERLDALLTLKHTVKEHDCKLTQEIIELIDREADLLMRGTKESNLEGLRKRISTLFLQYIKTPTFNAEAARLLKVPQDPSTLRKNIYFCPSCSSYLPSTEFQLSSNSKGVGRCKKCNKLDNDARERQDFSHYRYMLKALRRSEEAFQDGSRIAFLLQDADLRYLVEEIWNSQSALSAWADLYDLVLIRWDRDEEWSPWNCILLTKDEATAHFQVEDLEKNYGRVFCHKVKTKHTLSRNYFSMLPGMAEVMRHRSSKYANAGIITSKAVATMKA